MDCVVKVVAKTPVDEIVRLSDLVEDELLGQGTIKALDLLDDPRAKVRADVQVSVVPSRFQFDKYAPEPIRVLEREFKIFHLDSQLAELLDLVDMFFAGAEKDGEEEEAGEGQPEWLAERLAECLSSGKELRMKRALGELVVLPLT